MAKFKPGDKVAYKSEFYSSAEAREGVGIVTAKDSCGGTCNNHKSGCLVYYVASEEAYSVARPYTEEELTAI